MDGGKRGEIYVKTFFFNCFNQVKIMKFDAESFCSLAT